jgi:hypothetical protein
MPKVGLDHPWRFRSCLSGRGCRQVSSLQRRAGRRFQTAKAKDAEDVEDVEVQVSPDGGTTYPIGLFAGAAK